MSLLDALLLEPYRVNIWVAARTDGIAGSGTLSDPYDGSDPDVFDDLMQSFADQTTETVGVRVNLGPGIFETRGYYDNDNGWQPSSRMRIVGSGIDVTTLKLVSPAANDGQCFAVGHALGAAGGQVDFFEISDLTIDCNLSDQTNDVAAGAIRIKGNHSRIRRLKVINWGTRSAVKGCHVITAITADPLASTPGIFDAVIDECILVSPGEDTLGPITLLHIGGKDEATVQPEASGESAVIRNCFVDGTPNTGDPFDVEIRALSASFCHGAIIEGNQIYNVQYGGPFQKRGSIREVIVRNNFYKNVMAGPCFVMGALAPSSEIASISKLSSPAVDTARVTTSDDHGLIVGDRVKIDSTPDTYDGFVQVIGLPNPDQFDFSTTLSGVTSGGTMQKVIGVNKLLVEGNTIELALLTSGDPLPGIYVADQSLISTRPPFVNGQIILRDNRIRLCRWPDGCRLHWLRH